MDVTKMTEKELKALAYDELIRLEQSKQNLQVIQNRLVELQSKEKDVEKKEIDSKEKEKN